MRFEQSVILIRLGSHYATLKSLPSQLLFNDLLQTQTLIYHIRYLQQQIVFFDFLAHSDYPLESFLKHVKDLGLEIGRAHGSPVGPTKATLDSHYVSVTWECPTTHAVPVNFLDVIFDAIAKLVDWDIAAL